MSTALAKRGKNPLATKRQRGAFLRDFEARLVKNFGGTVRTIREMGFVYHRDWPVIVECIPEIEDIGRAIMQLQVEDARAVILSRATGRKLPTGLEIDDKKASLSAAKFVVTKFRGDGYKLKNAVVGPGGVKVEISFNAEQAAAEAEEIKEGDYRVHK